MLQQYSGRRTRSGKFHPGPIHSRTRPHRRVMLQTWTGYHPSYRNGAGTFLTNWRRDAMPQVVSWSSPSGKHLWDGRLRGRGGSLGKEGGNRLQAPHQGAEDIGWRLSARRGGPQDLLGKNTALLNLQLCILHFSDSIITILTNTVTLCLGLWKPLSINMQQNKQLSSWGVGSAEDISNS